MNVSTRIEPALLHEFARCGRSGKAIEVPYDKCRQFIGQPVKDGFDFSLVNRFKIAHASKKRFHAWLATKHQRTKVHVRDLKSARRIVDLNDQRSE